jgi:hypothetical protein
MQLSSKAHKKAKELPRLRPTEYFLVTGWILPHKCWLGICIGSWIEIKSLPNNRVVMRPSEKFEAKAAGQNPRKRS